MRTPVARRNSIDSKSVDSSGRYQHTQPYDRDRAMAGHLYNCGSQRAELVRGESGFGNKSWGVLKGVPRLKEEGPICLGSYFRESAARWRQAMHLVNGDTVVGSAFE